MKLNVLIACESSATVRDAFRALGHNAWSCDLLPCDGDPRYHFKGYVEELLRAPAGIPWPLNNRNGTAGPTSDWVVLPKWDLMIGHPPCTYLCNSGVRWLFLPPRTWTRPERDQVDARWVKMAYARDFFHTLLTSDVPYLALENPIPHRHAALPRYTQIIQPWQFGHGETKATCLWLKNLPKLVPTDVVAGREGRIWKTPPGPDRWKIRSKTFEGIAKAMSVQWSAHIINEKTKARNGNS